MATTMTITRRRIATCLPRAGVEALMLHASRCRYISSYGTLNASGRVLCDQSASISCGGSRASFDIAQLVQLIT